MNVKPYNTTDYENIANWKLGENKPNSKPIKPNLVRHSLGEGGTKPIKAKTNPIKPNFSKNQQT